MEYSYKTCGTCSKLIEFSLEDGLVKNVRFTGGCDGNLKAIGKLVEGMKAEEVIKSCKGISCGGRPTSCSDQLATALYQILAEQSEE
ncbi:TIGR03905 family TSCPD domain-containing protein [Sinanaerobacter sp. ZZT-01]|uniref:TIGR03905 family TSCPD domain-containing protein n=1 Tax=Sinanaerobacter sp. ZZT-01 TaxID=3111540 RepID=UPI002D76A358|nr:TIGR03905 family TSCPD domain-containing protein [Sinanaerobacter sp. ZZT-01]WRR92318.1 TIGR03905 family TSCPD domain-containing protein [Sinanaerobacter sp. ZZT-01]